MISSVVISLGKVGHTSLVWSARPTSPNVVAKQNGIANQHTPPRRYPLSVSAGFAAIAFWKSCTSTVADHPVVKMTIPRTRLWMEWNVKYEPDGLPETGDDCAAEVRSVYILSGLPMSELVAYAEKSATRMIT